MTIKTTVEISNTSKKSDDIKLELADEKDTSKLKVTVGKTSVIIDVADLKNAIEKLTLQPVTSQPVVIIPYMVYPKYVPYYDPLYPTAPWYTEPLKITWSSTQNWPTGTIYDSTGRLPED